MSEREEELGERESESESEGVGPGGLVRSRACVYVVPGNFLLFCGSGEVRTERAAGFFNWIWFCLTFELLIKGIFNANQK